MSYYLLSVYLFELYQMYMYHYYFGTPLCLTELDSGVLAALEAEGEQVLRAPLR